MNLLAGKPLNCEIPPPPYPHVSVFSNSTLDVSQFAGILCPIILDPILHCSIIIARGKLKKKYQVKESHCTVEEQASLS